jgi:predicted RNase H-like HicB family nuclease
MEENKIIKIIVEKHPDGYTAYPLGIEGVVVGQGETAEEAIADVKSALQEHIETFGRTVIEEDYPILEVLVTEVQITITPAFADMQTSNA